MQRAVMRGLSTLVVVVALLQGMAVTMHAQPTQPARPAAPPQLLCLAFPSVGGQPAGSGGGSLLQRLSACSRMIPLLQVAGITDWNQTYCGASVLPGLPPTTSSNTLMFTCRNYTSTELARFVTHVTRIWSALVQNRDGMRQSFARSYAEPAPQLQDPTQYEQGPGVRGPSMAPGPSQTPQPRGPSPSVADLLLLLRTNSNRLPVGALSVNNTWFPLLVDASTLSPPPPLTQGITVRSPPLPPVPPRPPGPVCPQGTFMRVDGMQLCVTITPQESSVDRSTGLCSWLRVLVQFQNIGTNLFPSGGLVSHISASAPGLSLLPLGPESSSPFYSLAPVARGVSAGLFLIIQNLGRNGARLPLLNVTFSITCDTPGPANVNNVPAACTCFKGIRLQPPSGGVGFRCLPPLLRSRRINNGTSSDLECFSEPRPAGPNPVQMLPPQSGSPGTCLFRVRYSVTNRGPGAVRNIFGPLSVDLSSGGLVSLALAGAVNATTSAGIGAVIYNLTDFGSPMDPNTTSGFSLDLSLNINGMGSCRDVAPVDLLSLIRFTAVPQPVTSVVSTSQLVGNPSTIPPITRFNDGAAAVVNSTFACVYPTSILMGWDAAAQTSYLYMTLSGALQDRPALHGFIPSDWTTINWPERFNAPRGMGPTQITRGASGDLNRLRIIGVTAYTFNDTSGKPYICGMDIRAVTPAEVTRGASVPVPTAAMGCSTAIVSSVTRTQVPQPVRFDPPPFGAFLGWFTGSVDSDRVHSLQPVWVTCGGADSPDTEED